MTLPSGTRLGPYEIVAAIGAGGMGEVYRARDTRLGRDVAIKVLPSHLSASPEVRARFEREARAISHLSHPHICTLHDIGHHDGTDFLVMELLEGETLAHRLERGPLPLPEVLRYGVEIAGALDVAHRGGIVHRDLKPGNIMLTKAGAKLMDFGLARAAGSPVAVAGLAESPTVSQPLTAEGAIVGTLQYMAPEQLEGKEADVRADLWALGCVLYEMATGRRAFAGTSQASLIAAVLKEAPRPMAELQPLTPPALDRIVTRCLEKDRDDRWQSARDLAFDLEGLRGASGVSAPTVAPGRTATRRRHAATLIAALAIAAACVATGFVIASRLTTRCHEPPTFTRLTFQRGFIKTARFAPDGQSVLYSAGWDGRPPEVFETRFDRSATRALGLEGIHLHAVSRTGELALMIGHPSTLTGRGSLAVAPLSGSAPRYLAEEVSQADWAPDGTTLAIVRRTGGEDNLEMPPGHVLVTTSGFLANVRISPDGRWVAFTEHPKLKDYRGNVAVADATGRKSSLTGEFANIEGLAWSPGGREIWFSSSVEGLQQSLSAVTLKGRQRSVARFPSSVVLQDIAADGRVLLYTDRRLTGIRGRSAAGDKERELGWSDASWPTTISADGRMLLFSDMGEGSGSNYTVCLRSMDGSPPVRLGGGVACALSPDGRWALAIHFGPPHRLILIPTGPGETLTLPRGPVETYQAAAFLLDGRRVVFVGAERERPHRTWVQELPGGLPRAITPEGTRGVRTSPDGRWLAAVTEDSTLVVVPLEDGEARQIAKLSPNEAVSQWSADGRTLFVGCPGTRLEVFAIDVESEERQLWRTFEVPDPAGAIMSTFVVTPDGRSYAYVYSQILDELYLVTGLE